MIAKVRAGSDRSVRFARRTRSALTVARANTVLPERPDRLPRALLAALQQGPGLAGAVAASAARYPNVTAIQSAEQRLTYRELWHRSGALASGMAEQGVTAQTRIGLLFNNSPAFALALIAVVRLGADVVLLNTALGHEQLQDTITSESLNLVLHDDDFASHLGNVRTLGMARLSQMAVDSSSRSVPAPPRASRLVVLTSGTTGRPRGATRESSAAAEGVAALLGRIPIRARDRIVIAPPFFHAWGLTMLSIGLGLSATITTSPKFNPAATLESVEAERASVLVVVPTMLQQICALPPTSLAATRTESLRVIASSGSAIPARLATEVLDRFGPVLYNVYGSTEVATAAVATPADLRVAPATAGRSALGVRVAILGPDGAPLGRATRGRIFVGNAARFDGYTDGGTKETVRGLVSSGDLGHFDRNGLLFVDGREDDMIVSGGENVYPREVEEVLNDHDAVEEAVVIAIQDENFGQALKAIVVLRDPESLVAADDLKAYVATRLARFKVPRVIHFVPGLPRNATGKVLRRELS